MAYRSVLFFALVNLALGSMPNNQRPNLVPPHGMWRGATLDQRGYPWISMFEMDYGVPLHIFRGFKTGKYTTLTSDETNFIKGGGIYFYSVEPHPWAEWTGNNETRQAEIEKMAKEIQSVAPAKVMLAPGFEPDGHAAESQNKTHLVYGVAADYQKMYLNFRRVFASLNVTNAVFVMDLSCSIKDNAFVLDKLYPGEGTVDWMFFNVFSSQTQKHASKGNCSAMTRNIYSILEANGKFDSIPWGVGAWGPMNATFGDPKDGYPSKLIPLADRSECINQMRDIFDGSTHGGPFEKLKAATYFNSLNSLISPRGKVSYSYPQLAPTLRSMFQDPVFTVNDMNTTSNTTNADTFVI